ncbi:MAG TPA: transglycosylase SLT domain-containing protein [bacterium]|nr:transglycosylase SLT domain-containing protein [bacterium]
MKRLLLYVLPVLIIPVICIAETSQHNSHETEAISKSRPAGMNAEPVNSTVQNEKLRVEFARIEKDYMNVVKYYNNRIPDAQALQIARFVLYYSAEFKLDPRLVMAVISVESKFKPRALSPKGAIGLGQLMPGTASMMGVKNAFDIKQNIYGTTRYLRKMYDRWSTREDVLELMLASYNAGPEAVEKYGGIPPYKETRNYVKKVKELFRFFIYG